MVRVIQNSKIRRFDQASQPPGQYSSGARSGSQYLITLDEKYALSQKMAREPGVEKSSNNWWGEFIGRTMVLLTERPAHTDIACGSNTSKAPADLVNTPFGGQNSGSRTEDYTALFEAWFCRMLSRLARISWDRPGRFRARNLDHYAVDLGQPGALDFLPDQSFDAVHDSRLFGSPEYRAVPQRGGSS